MTEEFQVIVVGGGLGGASAAIKLAQAGKKVILIDRGMPIGSKNLSGGVLWGNDLEEIIPGWQDQAPIERFVVKKKLGFLTESDSSILEFSFEEFKESRPGSIVLRAKFDDWLAEKAEEAGVSVHSGINVDALEMEDDSVVGINSNGETLRAPITIIMDGVNSRLTLDAGLRGYSHLSSAKHEYLQGVKEVLRLDRNIINERFCLSSDYGVAGEFVLGNTGKHLKVGGFLYTNLDSISLGIVYPLSDLTSQDRAYDLYNKFKMHPRIQEFISGAEIMEYGAKLIPAAGSKTKVQLYGNGFLVGGDAAGFVFSNGMVIQGMNYAAKSGMLAADATILALDKQDYSKRQLSHYKKLLDKSYIMKDLKRFKNVTKMTKNSRLFHVYPTAINHGFKNIINENGAPKQKIAKSLRKSHKQAGGRLLSLMRDGLRGMREL